jgi:putative phosphoribosyl transferase
MKPGTEQEVEIPLSYTSSLRASLRVPGEARGIVVFAHGSGSNRHSPRNRSVAARLVEAGFGTLLTDLFTAEEAQLDLLTRRYRFDVDMLAERLLVVTAWLTVQPSTRSLSIGYFGASTGAAAALIAAAAAPTRLKAVVSRGGRPDLAGAALARVRAPTLLIVGGADDAVLDLNRQALGGLAAIKRLEVVPGAGHLFEEPDALERVAELASAWFAQHLAQASERTFHRQ